MSEETLKKKLREQLRPRNVVRVVVGHSTKFVVTTAVVKLIQPEKTTDKVRTTVGGYVIGSMVADHTESYALRKYDEMRNQVEELKEELESTDAPTDPPTE